MLVIFSAIQNFTSTIRV